MPTETTPGRWTPAGVFAVPPVPDVRVPSDDDDGDGGGDDGGTADDPAEAANRDPLRQRRPRRRPVTVRRPASAAERLVPSSGDRPGCHLIRDFFEADRPYLFSPVRHRCRPLPPRLRPRRSTISRFCANPSRRPVIPTAGNTWTNGNNNYFNRSSCNRQNRPTHTISEEGSVYVVCLMRSLTRNFGARKTPVAAYVRAKNRTIHQRSRIPRSTEAVISAETRTIAFHRDKNRSSKRTSGNQAEHDVHTEYPQNRCS